MSQNATFNGTTYVLPTTGDTSWGTQVTNFMADVAANAITLTSTQTLSNKTIKFASGTAAAPGITFQADAATGVYQPATNQLALSTAGTQRLLVDGSGNVTIAGTVATGALSVTGTLGATGNTTVGGTLTVTGAATLSGGASVTGNLSSTATVSGQALSISSGGATINSNLGVVGNINAGTGTGTFASLAVTNSITTGANCTFPGFNNVGRNKIDNSTFLFWQRGSGPIVGASTYSADRWLQSFTNSSMSTSQITANDTDRSQIGDEECIYYFQTAVTGTGAAGDYASVSQPIERVLRLSGKTVTISFYARATSGTPKVGVSLEQFFGTGGSPSATVTATATPITLSTTWTRYNLTWNIPSATGKTLGTNLNDYTQLIFWLSSGSTNNTRAGSIGVQTATFQLWGVQVEIGSNITPLEKMPWAWELERCQRFYQVGIGEVVGCVGANAGYAGTWQAFPVYMRTSPTINCTNQSSSGMSGGNFVGNTGPAGFFVYYTCSAAGVNASATYTYNASADL